MNLPYIKSIIFVLLFGFLIPKTDAQDSSRSMSNLLNDESKGLADSTLLKLIDYTTKKWQQTVRSNLDSSLIYANKAAEFSKTIKNDSLLFHAYRRASNSLIEMGKLGEARKYCDKMFELLKEDDFYAAYRYYSNLGLIEKFQGNYHGALKNFLISLEKAEAGNLTNNIPAAYGEISRVFNEMGQPLEALKYAKKDVAFTMQHGKNRGKFISNYNLANKYVGLDSFNQALELYNLADSIGTILNIPTFNSAIDLSMGRLLIEMGDAEKALPLLTGAIEGMKKVGDLRGQLTAQLHLGRAYNRLSRHNEAVTILKETMEGLKTVDFKDVSQNTKQYYAKALYNTGNGLKAYELLEEFIVLEDSIKSKETSNAINELEVQYQTAEKERLINEQKLEIERGQFNRKLLLGGLAMAIWFGAVLVLYFWNKNNTTKKLALQEAKLNNQKILQLEQEKNLLAMTSMIEGQEAERKRIAMDLHDGLGGILVNIKSQLHALEKKVGELSQYDLYGKATGMIDNASREVRRIAYNMMPLALSRLGLKAAVEDMLTKIEHSENIKIRTHFSNLEDRLDETREVMIYRIIQELLNNVVKHAEATDLFVQINNVDNDLLITVEDNGIGFDIAKVRDSEGLGMKSIDSRVKFLEGTLDILSNNEGSSFNIHIPM